MSIIMKLLAVIVAIGGVVLLGKMNQHTPFGKGPEAFLAFLPSIVILVAVLYALGEILAKLNVVIASLDRPQVAPNQSSASPTPKSAAERFLTEGSRTSSE